MGESEIRKQQACRESPVEEKEEAAEEHEKPLTPRRTLHLCPCRVVLRHASFKLWVNSQTIRA